MPVETPRPLLGPKVPKLGVPMLVGFPLEYPTHTGSEPLVVTVARHGAATA